MSIAIGVCLGAVLFVFVLGIIGLAALALSMRYSSPDPDEPDNPDQVEKNLRRIIGK
jgi:hypothetical protein